MFKNSVILLCLLVWVLPLAAQPQSYRAANPHYIRSAELREQAILAFTAGNYAHAVSLLREATTYISVALSDYRASTPHYVRSTELREAGVLAFLAGDIDEAERLFAEAIEALDKAIGDENNVNIGPQDLADADAELAGNALAALNAVWLAEARSRSFDTTRSELFNRAEEAIAAAAFSLEAGQFAESVTHSDEALAIFREMFGFGANFELPESHIVVPGESLWRIAARPEVFNDRFAWRHLWEANRTRLRNPHNPDLIFPDQEFTIPRERPR
ncbi:MAG: LysM peptidoglycan-binding domain-containing protein [Spirochaetaceae bacterium]|nr:LysM peptidoglycan-binding domain-containing protein [Spirochaetaceae bacterium]